MSSYDETFAWPGPAADVILTGEFDDWKQSVHLAKTGDSFTGTAKIPYDSTIRYKFVVDGEWRVRDDQPTETGPDYITNNVIRTKPKPVATPVPATNGTSDVGLEPSAKRTPQEADHAQPLKALAGETPASVQAHPAEAVQDATDDTPTQTRGGTDAAVSSRTVILEDISTASHDGDAADISVEGLTAVGNGTLLDLAKTHATYDPPADPSSDREEVGTSAPTNTSAFGSLSDTVGTTLKSLIGIAPTATSTGESPKGPPGVIKVEPEHPTPAVHEVVSEEAKEKVDLSAATEVPVTQPLATTNGIVTPDPPALAKIQTDPPTELGKPAPINISRATPASTKNDTAESSPSTPASSLRHASHFRFPTSSVPSSPVKHESVPPREKRPSFFQKIKNAFSPRK